jgi:hypothetical protein
MRNTRIRPGVQSTEERGSRNTGFYVFCVFLVGYFLHVTARVQVLGMMHFDLLLAAVTAVAIALGRQTTTSGSAGMDPVAKRLLILVGYILVTSPFVEWPGSVPHNLEAYAKSLCFFFVATVDTTRKLKVLLTVYVTTQVWRVLEPLYTHVTSGGGLSVVTARLAIKLAPGAANGNPCLRADNSGARRIRGRSRADSLTRRTAAGVGAPRLCAKSAVSCGQR